MWPYEPCNTFFRHQYIEGIWFKYKFDAFVKDFGLKNAMFVSPGFITESSTYFTRFLSTVGRKAIRRREEDIHRYWVEDCMDDYWRIFDHSTAFKTNHGVNIIVSMPYGTEDMIIKEFKDMQLKHPNTRPIDMYFIDNKYKYRKNGDFMVMYVCWPIGLSKAGSFPLKAMNKKGDIHYA